MVNVGPLATLSLLFTILGTAFTFGRLYFRWIRFQILRWDDVFLFAALACSIGGYAIVAWMTYGVLIHAPPEHLLRILGVYKYYNKYNAQNEAFFAVYTLQGMFARLSLIYSYRGFCPYARFRLQRRAVNVTGILCVVLGMLFTYGVLFPCSPPNLMRYPTKLWYNGDTTFCLRPNQIFWYSWPIMAACDIMVWLLPFWLLRKYKEELNEPYQRHGRWGLYALGSVAVLLGPIRIPVLWNARSATLGVGGPQALSLYSQMTMFVLTIAQANVYLIVASIPTLRRLVPRFRPEDHNGSTAYSEQLPTISNSNSGNEQGQDFINLGRDFEDESFRQSSRAEMQQRHMHLRNAKRNSGNSNGKYNSYGSRTSRNASTANSLSGISGKSAHASHLEPDEDDSYDLSKSGSPDAKDTAVGYLEMDHLQTPAAATHKCASGTGGTRAARSRSSTGADSSTMGSAV